MDDSTNLTPEMGRSLRGGKVTIRDLADHLGLTKGTVSRALNGYADISPDTRKRVAEAAEALGYRPSTQARAIRTGRAEAIGLVLNVDEDNAYKPFLSDFLDGISRRLGEAGWTLSVATAFSQEDALSVYRRLAAEKKVDGFILPRTKLNDPRVTLLRDLGVPFVLFGRTGDPTGCAWYDILGENAMAEAVRRLASLGHRRIGYLGAKAANNFQALRLAGYRKGLAAAGFPHDPALEVEGAMSQAEGRILGRHLLAMGPTAVVCAVDRAALGLCQAIRDLGLRPGRDVSVIAYDGIPEGAWAEPPLTTFAVDTRQAGYRLADLLIRRIDGEPPEALREEADAALVARGTDGPPEMKSEEIAARAASYDDQREEV